MTDDGNPQTAYELIAQDNPAAILKTLVSLKVCAADESITEVTIAGEGNMNLVLRVKTDRNSLIVKQARPWVEKYPQIAASDERILSEIEFYRCISKVEDVRSTMPSVLAWDTSLRLMVLEDLGAASDYASLYSGQSDASEVDLVFGKAIHWVTGLHRCDTSEEPNLGCEPLLGLNHQHMFSLPLSDPPAIDLDQVCDGLTKASRPLCANELVASAMQQLGVIDPEFCFCGPMEFDLGVLAAHWIFCGSEAGDATIDRVCDACSKEVSRELLMGFAGAELVRRLVGVAQLPLDADLATREKWLQCGVTFLEQYMQGSD